MITYVPLCAPSNNAWDAVGELENCSAGQCGIYGFPTISRLGKSTLSLHSSTSRLNARTDSPRLQPNTVCSGRHINGTRSRCYRLDLVGILFSRGRRRIADTIILSEEKCTRCPSHCTLLPFSMFSAQGSLVNRYSDPFMPSFTYIYETCTLPRAPGAVPAALGRGSCTRTKRGTHQLLLHMLSHSAYFA